MNMKKRVLFKLCQFLMFAMVFTLLLPEGALKVNAQEQGIYLYEHSNYGGRELYFGPGRYNLDEDYGFDDRLSSLRVVGNFGMTLYQDDWSDTSETFYSNDSTLTNNKVGNDKVSTITVFEVPGGGEGVYLYEHANYGGRVLHFGPGRYNLDEDFGFDDKLSSLKIVGNYSVTLYQDDWSDTDETFYSNDASLTNNRVGNDKVSTIIVNELPKAGEEGVYLYEDSNYGGRVLHFGAGRYNLDEDYGFDDKLSSLKITGDYSVTLYQDDWSDTDETFYSNDSWLGDNRVGNDKVSTIIVTKLPAAGEEGVYLYENSDYGGRELHFGAGRYNLDEDYGFDDKLSSVKIIGDYSVTLYQDDWDSGESIFNQNKIETFYNNDSNLTNNSVGNDKVSTITVTKLPELPSNAQEGVYLYEHEGYGGRVLHFDSGSYDLDKDYGFGDLLSSLRVVGDYVVILYEHKWSGTAEIFDNDDPRLAYNLIGNDTVTSIKVFNIADLEEDSYTFQDYLDVMTTISSSTETQSYLPNAAQHLNTAQNRAISWIDDIQPLALPVIHDLIQYNEEFNETYNRLVDLSDEIFNSQQAKDEFIQLLMELQERIEEEEANVENVDNTINSFKINLRDVDRVNFQMDYNEASQKIISLESEINSWERSIGDEDKPTPNSDIQNKRIELFYVNQISDQLEDILNVIDGAYYYLDSGLSGLQNQWSTLSLKFDRLLEIIRDEMDIDSFFLIAYLNDAMLNWDDILELALAIQDKMQFGTTAKNLNAQIVEGGIQLTWDHADIMEQYFAGQFFNYQIYRDGKYVTQTAYKSFTHELDPSEMAEPHDYTVRLFVYEYYDTSPPTLLIGEFSDPVTVDVVGTTAKNLNAQVVEGGIQLTWDHAEIMDEYYAGQFFNYQIYRDGKYLTQTAYKSFTHELDPSEMIQPHDYTVRLLVYEYYDISPPTLLVGEFSDPVTVGVVGTTPRNINT
ncbi:HBL/NHE enterotoxin family protein [Chengkuizengella sediminis]|uniref:HBL/NHE enterotoxin family protein n=1 Tax=Chengkuizengella sediminis TaxID=1885917 RepID=UPI00138A5A11|nr:HBL/NHE enterotoxin family protein [Chengkuizengella sediminis]NDI33917.1 HBL/NHE enterotoxin family protein [Chengkuizengella sediminis]